MCFNATPALPCVHATRQESLARTRYLLQTKDSKREKPPKGETRIFITRKGQVKDAKQSDRGRIWPGPDESDSHPMAPPVNEGGADQRLVPMPISSPSCVRWGVTRLQRRESPSPARLSVPH